MVTKRSLITKVLIVAGILILVNVLSNRFFMRFDFTEDRLYSLSKATKDIIKNLDEPVTITAYFTEGLPVNYDYIRKDFKSLLVEYHSASRGDVVYTFINPNESDETELEAQQAGIAMVVVDIRERDQMQQKRSYFGAVVTKGNKTDVIPFVQSVGEMEYNLSKSIRKISVNIKPALGLIQGHGEPTMEAMSQAMAELAILYDVQPLFMNDSTAIPSIFKTVVIVAPTDSFPISHLNHLDGFLGNGGRILVAFNRVKADLNRGYGEPLNTGLEGWLERKGINVGENFVIDVNSGRVLIRQQFGNSFLSIPVQLHYFPIITNFADHPITKGLDKIMMQFVSSISFVSFDTSIKYEPIAFTSERANILPAPISIDVRGKQWTENDFIMSKIPVAGLLEGRLGSGEETRMVVICDGDFIINGEGEGAQRLENANVSFFVNAIDWLSDENGLMDLRTKGITSRTIKQLESNKRSMIKIGNSLIPLLVIIYGLIRYQFNRARRKKWMAMDYTN